MADEAVLAVPGMDRLTYTLKQYLSYASALQEKAKQLSESGSQPVLSIGSNGHWNLPLLGLLGTQSNLKTIQGTQLSLSISVSLKSIGHIAFKCTRSCVYSHLL